MAIRKEANETRISSIDLMSFRLNIYSVKIFCSITPTLEQFNLFSFRSIWLRFASTDRLAAGKESQASSSDENMEDKPREMGLGCSVETTHQAVQCFTTLLGSEGENSRLDYSVVSLKRAGPGVGGGVVLPLSVSVGLALKLLLSDVFVGVGLGVLLVDLGGRHGSDEGNEDELHFNNYN